MANNLPPEKKLDSFNYSSESATRRKRTVFKKEQIDILKIYFQNNPYPGIEEREELSRLTNIPEARIHVWFQNRRARQAMQQKKRTSEVFTSLRRMFLKDVSLGSILEEDFSEQKLAMSWSGEPSQEADLRSGCSLERRSTASVTEAPGLCGYGISQSHPFFSSHMVRPSTELQPSTLPRPMTQRSSSQWASSWALQGTQGPENYNTHTSFYGEVKPPLHIQDQSWTVKQLYSKDHSWSFRYTEEPSHQLQQPHPHQPSALQPLVPQVPTFEVQQLTSSQQSQRLQDQTLLPPLVKEEEESYELFCSFKQEHSIDVSKKSVGLESTLLLPAPQGHLGDPLRDLVDHQGYLTDTQGHLADSVSNLADILGGLD